MTTRYLGVSGLAGYLGVTRHAVSKWRDRYPEESDHPFPQPDVTIGSYIVGPDGELAAEQDDDEPGVPGWLPDRLPEIEAWREGLPGRGFGGGRPRTTATG